MCAVTLLRASYGGEVIVECTPASCEANEPRSPCRRREPDEFGGRDWFTGLFVIGLLIYCLLIIGLFVCLLLIYFLVVIG